MRSERGDVRSGPRPTVRSARKAIPRWPTRPALGPDTESLILSGEPALEYQPLVDLTSGRLLGFEALLRWRHPDEGIILPSLLLPWLEANGDIVQLGEWVLTEGCQQAAGWPENIQLAVNLSHRPASPGRGQPTRWPRPSSGPGIEPGRLTVEVTEHAMVEDVAMNDLRAIGALGVELAVDDVGTSWTSFDVLRRMAVNTVKIDRSFVGALETQQGINRLIVETVVSLAHSEGISTVAEGVETAQQAAIVREFECDAAQGYFFAPPLSIEVATELANEPGFCFPSRARAGPATSSTPTGAGAGRARALPARRRNDGTATSAPGCGGVGPELIEHALVLLAVPAETRPGERRVAMVPAIAARLVEAGWGVTVQSGAGAAAAFPDDAYAEAGATVAPDAGRRPLGRRGRAVGQPARPRSRPAWCPTRGPRS